MAHSNQQDTHVAQLSGASFFAKLPRELRDEIYRYAFIEEQGRISRYARRASRQFQAMHVSRQFEAEAIQEWFRHHTIVTPNPNFCRYLYSKNRQLRNNVVSLRSSWENSHSVEGNNVGILSAVDGIRDCSSLRLLRLKVFEPIFDISDRCDAEAAYLRDNDHDGEAAYLRDHDYSDLWAIQEVQDLCTMPKLQKVTLVPAERRDAAFGKTPEEHGTWSENVQKLEDFMNDFLRQRGTSGVNARPGPRKLDLSSFPVHREKMTRFFASTPGGCAGCGRKICGNKRASHNTRAGH